MFAERYHPKHPLMNCAASFLPVRPEAFHVNGVFIRGGLWILFVDACCFCGEFVSVGVFLQECSGTGCLCFRIVKTLFWETTVQTVCFPNKVFEIVVS